MAMRLSKLWPLVSEATQPEVSLSHCIRTSKLTINLTQLNLHDQILIFKTVAIRNTISNHLNVPHPLALPATLHFLLRKTFSVTKEAMVMSDTFVITSAALPQLAESSLASLERTTGEDISKSSILELPSANLDLEQHGSRNGWPGLGLLRPPTRF
jgi:hypothetical protein